MKFALYPGGFKPPHQGHYLSALWLASNLDVDKVIVKIGSKVRDGITRDMAVNIWNLYKLSDKDPDAKKIEAIASNSPSPVKDVYDFVGNEAPEDSIVYLALGEKDSQDGRYNRIGKYAEDRNITVKIIEVPTQAGGISGTQMRQFIMDDNKESFFNYIPSFLSDSEKEAVWDEVSAAILKEWGATMNNQELKKHKQKLSKLRKIMDKQKDREIEYPTNLPKTVIGVDTLPENRIFSPAWWSKVFEEENTIQEIIKEGGASGHMKHPFDLPQVKNGKDLIDIFNQSVESIKKSPAAVKLDGFNTSIRLANIDGKREFGLDRGSKKELDIRGVTKDKLEDRFGAGHGFIEAGGEVLDIFNKALPKIQPELKALGLIDDPFVLFNMEYVKGQSNLKNYNQNFIAIHNVLKSDFKDVEGKRGNISKRVTFKLPTNPDVIQSLLDKLNPIAEKFGFKVFGSIPTEFTKDPNFNSVLSQRYTINNSSSPETKSLKQWLDYVDQIPLLNDVSLKINGKVKKVTAMANQVYNTILGGANVDELFDNERDIELAKKGFITKLATEKLGEEVLKILDSPMGKVEDHEGIVINDDEISKVPYKITGTFSRMNHTQGKFSK